MRVYDYVQKIKFIIFACIVMCVYFQVSNYAKEMEEMKHVTKQEFIASLRRFA